MTTTLIVDDELDMRLLIRMIIDLANAGLQVVGEASNGPEAIAQWRAMDPPSIPDVVVLDNRMPGLTGLEVAEKILAEVPDQIVVLYSAFMDDNIRIEAARVGIRACLAKTDIDELPHLIRDLAQR